MIPFDEKAFKKHFEAKYGPNSKVYAARLEVALWVWNQASPQIEQLRKEVADLKEALNEVIRMERK